LKETLQPIMPPRKTQIRPSPLSGYGVFATEDIVKDEVFEQCPFVVIPEQSEDSSLWHFQHSYPKVNGALTVMPVFGFGCAYNTSDTPNVTWYELPNRRVFEYKALRDIKAGEELLVDYSESVYDSEK
jgi:SET domain-containing protein